MFTDWRKPLDQHYDGGLGATGEAFEEAADMLTESGEGQRLINIHLPTNFLYRHESKCFSESMIIVLHRALVSPYGKEPPEGTPLVPVDGKWKPLHKEHRISVLWGHVVELIRSNEPELTARCRTRWSSFPEEMGEAIAAVDAADPTSTFFRYTDRRTPEADREKSSWKEGEAGESVAQMKPEGEPVKAFFLIGPDGDIARSYRYYHHAFEEVSKLLAETAKTLSGAHTGLRVELANGF